MLEKKAPHLIIQRSIDPSSSLPSGTLSIAAFGRKRDLKNVFLLVTDDETYSDQALVDQLIDAIAQQQLFQMQVHTSSYQAGVGGKRGILQRHASPVATLTTAEASLQISIEFITQNQQHESNALWQRRVALHREKERQLSHLLRTQLPYSLALHVLEYSIQTLSITNHHDFNAHELLGRFRRDPQRRVYLCFRSLLPSSPQGYDDVATVFNFKKPFWRFLLQNVRFLNLCTAQADAPFVRSLRAFASAQTMPQLRSLETIASIDNDSFFENEFLNLRTKVVFVQQQAQQRQQQSTATRILFSRLPQLRGVFTIAGTENLSDSVTKLLTTKYQNQIELLQCCFGENELQVMQACQQLKFLSISFTLADTDVAASQRVWQCLQNHTKLRNISVSGRARSDLDCFPAIPSLYRIYAQDLQVRSLAGIEHLTELKELEWSHLFLSDPSELELLLRCRSLHSICVRSMDAALNARFGAILVRLLQQQHVYRVSLPFPIFECNNVLDAICAENCTLEEVNLVTDGAKPNCWTAQPLLHLLLKKQPCLRVIALSDSNDVCRLDPDVQHQILALGLVDSLQFY